MWENPFDPYHFTPYSLWSLPTHLNLRAEAITSASWIIPQRIFSYACSSVVLLRKSPMRHLSRLPSPKGPNIFLSLIQFLVVRTVSQNSDNEYALENAMMSIQYGLIWDETGRFFSGPSQWCPLTIRSLLIQFLRRSSTSADSTLTGITSCIRILHFVSTLRFLIYISLAKWTDSCCLPLFPIRPLQPSCSFLKHSGVKRVERTNEGTMRPNVLAAYHQFVYLHLAHIMVPWECVRISEFVDIVRWTNSFFRGEIFSISA